MSIYLLQEIALHQTSLEHFDFCVGELSEDHERAQRDGKLTN